jgi:hypothetical protein
MSETELTDAQIAELVAGLFVPWKIEGCYERLKTAGDRAVPFLVSALEDPRIPATAFISPGLLNSNSPYYLISDLLENSRSADAAAPFVEYVNGPDPRFRQDGALRLGAIGLETCIEPMKRILTGDDRDLRGYVLMGIERALTSGRATPEFIGAIRPCLVDLLKVPDRFGQYPAPGLLVRIDAQYATRTLLSPDHLSLDNPGLRYVIAALNDAGSPIPHASLLPLIDQLEPLAGEYRRSSELNEALLAYARNPDGNAEARLRGLLKPPDEGAETEAARAWLRPPLEQVQTGAARALAALNGLEDFDRELIRIEIDEGAGALSGAERNFRMASMYYWEVMNDGLWQYLECYAAQDHGAILDALRAIGAPKTAQVLETAGNVFGPEGPPSDPVKCAEMVRSFSDAQAEIISNLNQNSLIPDDENIEMLLYLYAAEHKDEFRACASRPS